VAATEENIISYERAKKMMDYICSKLTAKYVNQVGADCLERPERVTKKGK
jgi:hypothetical protein